MNPNLIYQLYQTERIKTRAEILADDARRGRQAAAVSRSARRLARVTLGPVVSRAYRRRSPSMA